MLHHVQKHYYRAFNYLGILIELDYLVEARSVQGKATENLDNPSQKGPQIVGLSHFLQSARESVISGNY